MKKSRAAMALVTAATERYSARYTTIVLYILSAVDPGAYLTGFYALFRGHLVTQVPTEVTCFTDRRH